jgi:hypothetical protein
MLGDCARRAGVATRADIGQLHAELNRLREETLHGEQAVELATTRQRLSDLQARLDELTEWSTWLVRVHNELEGHVATLENLAAIDAVTRFVRHAPLRRHPLVSVILPTCNRPQHLPRAIDSVRRQHYCDWELIVVDDGSDPDCGPATPAPEDERIRWLRIDKSGVCVARNTALSVARGEIIAYMDDDNLMDPGWLAAVVWAFEQRPDVDVLYGAFVVDDLLRVDGRSSGQLPRTFLHSWNREALRQSNLADMGAMAHRSGLPEAHFDEGLREMGDWDLLLRLTEERDPLVLPAIACYYTTDAPHRLSGGPTHRADHARIASRAGLASR